MFRYSASLPEGEHYATCVRLYPSAGFRYGKVIHFYTEVLGFALKQGGTDEIYSEIDTGAHVLALFDRAAMLETLGESPVKNATFSIPGAVLCMAVDDVDAVCADIEAKGVKAITPPTDRQEWGIRTAHFYDPDSNIVEINQNL